MNNLNFISINKFLIFIINLLINKLSILVGGMYKNNFNSI